MSAGDQIAWIEEADGVKLKFVKLDKIMGLAEKEPASLNAKRP